MPTIDSRPKFDPTVYKLLKRIQERIDYPVSIAGVPNKRLVELIVDAIKETGDSLGTPVFRIDTGFAIYQNGRQLPIFKKSFEEYLAWVAKDFGIGEETVYDIPFRNMLFGCAWHGLVPEE